LSTSQRREHEEKTSVWWTRLGGERGASGMVAGPTRPPRRGAQHNTNGCARSPSPPDAHDQTRGRGATRGGAPARHDGCTPQTPEALIADECAAHTKLLLSQRPDGTSRSTNNTRNVLPKIIVSNLIKIPGICSALRKTRISQAGTVPTLTHRSGHHEYAKQLRPRKSGITSTSRGRASPTEGRGSVTARSLWDQAPD
jgi:hypothetical protein